MKTKLHSRKNFLISHENIEDLMKNPTYVEVLEDLLDREILLQINPEEEDLMDWSEFKQNLK